MCKNKQNWLQFNLRAPRKNLNYLLYPSLFEFEKGTGSESKCLEKKLIWIERNQTERKLQNIQPNDEKLKVTLSKWSDELKYLYAVYLVLTICFNSLSNARFKI
jgi:hypothetical protein